MDRSTIAAIATAPGSAGIGIIKISGPEAVSIASTVFRRTAARPKSSGHGVLSHRQFSSHRLYHGYVADPATGSILDEVLLSVMRAPRSYTGEDVVEINTHSGPVVLKTILNLVLHVGARMAEPGEFTKRAFLSGRIDLTQAEAVIDIINARSESALEIAAVHMEGGLRDRVMAVREALTNVITLLEAAIDFPEDVEPVNSGALAGSLEQEVLKPLAELMDHYRGAHFYREGLRLAVVGRPNVGKSSLLNRLVRKDRAIVSPVPGTTRDFIEETIMIRGLPVILADTAGLHDSDDPVEIIGIRKTREYIGRSDLVLFMLDAGTSLTSEDHQIFENVRTGRVILVLNKQDLIKAGGALCLPPDWQHLPQSKISALYNQGIEDLEDLIATICTGDPRLDLRDKIIPNLRQKQLLDLTRKAVQAGISGIRAGSSDELIVLDLQEAADGLAEILGCNVKEDILDQIFSRFCIGK